MFEKLCSFFHRFNENFCLLTFTSLSILIQLPQQENSFDCGLFLLHYVECFLNEAPSSFSPFKIMEFSNFVSILLPFSKPELANFLLFLYVEMACRVLTFFCEPYFHNLKFG